MDLSKLAGSRGLIALVVGGMPDTMRDWRDRLADRGIALKYHHTYNSEGGRTKEIPDDVDLVLIVHHLIQVNHMQNVEANAQRHGCMCVRVDRQWSHVAAKLDSMGLRTLEQRAANADRKKRAEPPPRRGALPYWTGLLAGGPEDLYREITNRVAQVGINLTYHRTKDKSFGRPLPADVDVVIILKDLMSHSHEENVVAQCKASGVRFVRTVRKWAFMLQALEAEGFELVAKKAVAAESSVVAPAAKARTILEGETTAARTLAATPRAKPKPEAWELTDLQAQIAQADERMDRLKGELAEEERKLAEEKAKPPEPVVPPKLGGLGLCSHGRSVKECGLHDFVLEGVKAEELEEGERPDNKLSEQEEAIFERMLEMEEKALAAQRAAGPNQQIVTTVKTFETRPPGERVLVHEVTPAQKTFVQSTLDVFTEATEPLEIGEVIRRIDPTKEGAIRGAVKRLADMGLVVRLERGLYRAIRPGETVPPPAPKETPAPQPKPLAEALAPKMAAARAAAPPLPTGASPLAAGLVHAQRLLLDELEKTLAPMIDPFNGQAQQLIAGLVGLAPVVGNQERIDEVADKLYAAHQAIIGLAAAVKKAKGE